MPETEYITTLRQRIGDEKHLVEQRFIGNGTLNYFTITDKNPFEFVITVDGTTTPDADYTYDDDLKKIIFDPAHIPPADEEIVIRYYSNAFTDDEIIKIYTDNGSDVDHTTAELIRRALGSQSRMVSFQHGDRSVSMSDIFKNLMSMLDKYEKRISNTGSNSDVAVGKRTMTDREEVITNPDDISRLFFS